MDINSLMQPNPALVLLVVALAAPLVVALGGAWRSELVGKVAIVMTGAAFATAIWTCFVDDATFDVAWASTWDLRFTLVLDGLARLYALLATGIGFFVVVYAFSYIPLHLHHDHRPLDEQTRFFGFLLLFMGAMVGLVMAQDMILLFLFWDLTAIASYFLIGYDRGEEESRSSAMMALLVTGISAVLVMIGAVILGNELGTYNLGRIFSSATPERGIGIAALLVTVGALAKSAQVPLHFWLPRAMAAPTPVSAYLHSAAMVAAGVFLIGRMYPLISLFDWLLDGLLVIGYASLVVGGVLALTRQVLKQVLAYSTISQYGYVVVMFGLGGEKGVAGATFYVLAHALVKSALFLTAGAVTEATGKKHLADLGGLWRRMPLLAFGSGLAAAGLIALPLTIGFFKDELFFAAAYEHGTGYAVLAVLGASLTFTYIARFWTTIFLGRENVAPKAIPGTLVWPVVVLGVATLIGGLWTAPAIWLVEHAATVSAGMDVHLHIAYHLDTRPENVMAVATWLTGTALLVSRPVWLPAAIAAARLGEKLGPARAYYEGLRLLNRVSDAIHTFEVRDLRSRVATILVPAGVLVGVAVIVTPNSDAFHVGSLARSDIPLITMIGATLVSALVVTIVRDHFRLALSLSAVGFSLAVVYALLGAADVTLVAIVVETIFSVLFMGMLALMPRPILRYETAVRGARRLVRRDVVMAVIAGAMAFFVVWGALSQPAPSTEVIEAHQMLTPLAHGKDIVTVILADFRGFDTMGEITVIALTLLGIMSLLRSGRLR
ncbi:MAG TPA: hydrogen gas-evolving membrane-bound hydrogenase subunit E [Thermomicrobiales bacterium]|nr:hydrogen gas-evolving membrane-bound hydrogenase subunit E [Thermomicrobiales bacterium]